MTVARLADRAAGVPRAPGFPFLARWDGFAGSGGLRDGLDALPGGGDRLCPGPGGGDFQGSAASAADEAGGGAKDAVAQGLRLCCGEAAVQGRGATFYFTLNAKEAPRYPVITLSHCYNTNREAASPARRWHVRRAPRGDA